MRRKGYLIPSQDLSADSKSICVSFCNDIFYNFMMPRLRIANPSAGS